MRLLNRHGVEMVVAEGQGCCGALAHHMGEEDEAQAKARTISPPGKRKSPAAGWMRS